MEKPLVHIETYCYRFNSKELFNIDFLKIFPRDIIQLSGNSGVGKTVFAHGLMGFVSQAASVDLSLEWDNKNSEEKPTIQAWRKDFCSIIFQQPKSYFHPVLNIYQQIIEASTYGNTIETNVICQNYLDQLALPSIDELKNQYASTMSVGQLQRLMIIMALIKKPKFIIADEIFAHLDYKNASQAKSLINHYIKENNAACIIISHDVELIENWANRHYELKNGNLLEIKKLSNTQKSQKSNINLKNSSNNSIIELININKSFSKNNALFEKRNNSFIQVLSNINLNINSGDRIGLIGASGSGKTTIGHIISQIESFDNGELKSNFRPLSFNLWRRKSADVQMIFQDPFLSFNPARTIAQQFKKLNTSKVNQLLSEMHLDKEILNQKPAQLSGGQLQRLSLVSALSVQPFPKLLILDEAFSALDRENIIRIITLLNSEQYTELAIVYISHRFWHLEQLCDTFYTLKDGIISKAIQNEINAITKLKSDFSLI